MNCEKIGARVHPFVELLHSEVARTTKEHRRRERNRIGLRRTVTSVIRMGIRHDLRRSVGIAFSTSRLATRLMDGN